MHRRSLLRARSRTALVATAAGVVTVSGLALAAVAPAQAAPSTKVVLSHTVDFSETRATGHNDVVDGGVRVWTEGNTSTDKAAAYFDASVPLADAGEPSMAWTANEGNGNLKPSVQLKTDFDGDGSIDGILVGEPTYADGSTLYGDDWWLSNGSSQFVKDAAPLHTGGSGSDNHGTLDQWREVFEDAQVIQSGWSLGSGVKGDGTIASITVGETTYTFAESPAATTRRLYKTDVEHTDTRATGHNDFREEGGVRVWTEGSTSTDKATGYFAVDAPLADAGEPAMVWSRNAAQTGNVKPGMQLVTDFDGDGEADGILVGEPTYADGTRLYGTVWWVNNGADDFVKTGAPRHGGGFGSDNFGLLSEWRAAFPDAQVLQAGWSLGSGVQGDGVISSITVGTDRFTFTGLNRLPRTEVVRATATAGVPLTVTLPGVDDDEDALSFTASAGTVDGDRLTFDTPADFVGVEVVEFEVSDGRDSVPGVVVIRAAKADAAVKVTTKPAAVTTATKNVKLKARVTSTGEIGQTVRFFDGDKRVGVATIRPDGIALLKVGRLAKGKHVITAVYGGSPSTAKAEGRLRFRVTRG